MLSALDQIKKVFMYTDAFRLFPDNKKKTRNKKKRINNKKTEKIFKWTFCMEV